MPAEYSSVCNEEVNRESFKTQKEVKSKAFMAKSFKTDRNNKSIDSTVDQLQCQLSKRIETLDDEHLGNILAGS